MAEISLLTGRAVKVYMRDKAAVFFSFLSMFIIIGLYALFLGDMTANSVSNSVKDPSLNTRFLVDSWMMAGLMIVNSVTIALGVFGIMVEDITKKRIQGFLVAPVSRAKLVVGYLAASWIVTFTLCLVSIVLAEIYIVATGGDLLPAAALAKVVGITALSVFSSSAMMFFFISFVKTNGAFSTISTLVGTLIGFVTGIYVPMGALPEVAQSFIKFIPATYLTAMMRQVFTAAPMADIFKNAPAGMAEDFSRVFGITLKWGDTVVTAPVSIAIAAGSGILFLGLSVLVISRKKTG